RYSEIKGKTKAIDLLHKIFKSVSLINPSKDSVLYWTMINRTMLEFDEDIHNLWLDEKKSHR
ncbi:HindIII family type II restriction endonuclease, partial [Morganella psychrotolerans]|uniref:HindIII family type II restriction endonuclease n=1 Tax=Morganella psychrotolerans TaxID=368603 RepID=UPI000A7E506A